MSKLVALVPFLVPPFVCRRCPGQVRKPRYPCFPTRLPGVPAPSCAAGSWTISSCARPPYWLLLGAAIHHQLPMRTRRSACVVASSHATHVLLPRGPAPVSGALARPGISARSLRERSPHGGTRGKNTVDQAGVRAT